MDAKAIKDYRIILFYVALLWALELVDLALGHSLDQFGLVPRQTEHLYGIVSMHFLHGGFGHLISNSLPLLVLGFLVSANHKAIQVTVSIMLLTGISVWIAARHGNHVGASGLVMGYFGYLLSSAFFQRSLKSFILLAMTVVFYGGLVFTLLDFRGWISFEGHIFGFVSGIVSAKIWHSKKNRSNNWGFK